MLFVYFHYLHITLEPDIMCHQGYILNKGGRVTYLNSKVGLAKSESQA